MKLLTHDELLDLYNQSESCDQELFAEMRSNLLLVAGDHYNKKGSRYWNRIRESKDLSSEQKLRLTKNHIQKISKTYVNSIVAYAPSVTAAPNNPKEYQDQKSAELNKSVIQFAKKRHKVATEKTLQWAQDFVDIGEVCTKLFWDPYAGDYIGEEPEIDPETGAPVLDDEGNPKTSPKFSGDIVIERVYGFNLLRSPTAQNEMVTASPLIIRKMVNTEDLKKKVGDDTEKLRYINETEDKTFHVFDASSGQYSTTPKGQTMLLEYYYPACILYPKGYFYYTTLTGILWHGELPFGIWPIVYTGFDAVQTSPRHRSIIKQLRPYQAEINRTASKIAEHQVTQSDDKLLLSKSASISNGIQLAGIRTVQYSGAKPEVLPGRVGQQYFEYLNSQIKEMYEVANLDYETAEKAQQGDLMMQLFNSIKQKKKNVIYNSKFENFLVQFWETYLALAKAYFTEEMIIPMVGKDEVVNMEEFRNTEKLSYQITLEPQTDDVESMMGRQMVFNHALQYVGEKLDPKSIGKIMRAMPFGNFKEAFSELTMDEDMATNMVLALDRGEVPLPNKYDEHLYMVKRLTERVRQADFMLLDPKIQKNYDTMIQFYEKLETQRQMEIQKAQKGFIPSGGARIKCDFYIPSPGNPNRNERATLPAESVSWLIDQLAKQGSSQEALSQLNTGAVAEMSAQFNQMEGSKLEQAGVGQSQENQMGQTSPNMGIDQAQGVLQ